MTPPWPALERRIGRLLAAGATVLDQGDWVRIDTPGIGVSWVRAEHFQRAQHASQATVEMERARA